MSTRAAKKQLNNLIRAAPALSEAERKQQAKQQHLKAKRVAKKKVPL
jgi:hypothetical protein